MSDLPQLHHHQLNIQHFDNFPCPYPSYSIDTNTSLLLDRHSHDYWHLVTRPRRPLALLYTRAAGIKNVSLLLYHGIYTSHCIRQSAFPHVPRGFDGSSKDTRIRAQHVLSERWCRHASFAMAKEQTHECAGY